MHDPQDQAAIKLRRDGQFIQVKGKAEQPIVIATPDFIQKIIIDGQEFHPLHEASVLYESAYAQDGYNGYPDHDGEADQAPDIESIRTILDSLEKSAGMNYDQFIAVIDTGEVKNYSKALLIQWRMLDQTYKELSSK